MENDVVTQLIRSKSASLSGVIYVITKRLFDILFSVTLLILSSPIWLISIIGIKISSPGPIFYKACRVGKGAKVFQMLKFRSMHVDDNANEKSLRPDANRIFKYGAFMRATKIDELPQLLNVLFAQMSIVGPRPAAEDQVEVTRSGENKAVYAVKVGLTSPAALYDYIYGDAVTDAVEYETKVLSTRLALDLLYLKKRSLLYDLKMIVYTAVCVIQSFFHVHPQGIYRKLMNTAKRD